MYYSKEMNSIQHKKLLQSRLRQTFIWRTDGFMKEKGYDTSNKITISPMSDDECSHLHWARLRPWTLQIHFKAYSQRLNTNIGKAFHYKMIISLNFPEQEEQPTGWGRRKGSWVCNDAIHKTWILFLYYS